MRFDRKAFWNILKINGVGGQLLAGVKVFFIRKQVRV